MEVIRDSISSEGVPQIRWERIIYIYYSEKEILLLVKRDPASINCVRVDPSKMNMGVKQFIREQKMITMVTTIIVKCPSIKIFTKLEDSLPQFNT